jgi:hypothetical protein
MTGVRAGRFHRGRDHKTRETGLKRLYIYMEIPQGNSLCSYLKSTKMSFFSLLQNQRTEGQNRSCLGRLIPVGGGKERVWEGEYSANTMYTCMRMEK